MTEYSVLTIKIQSTKKDVKNTFKLKKNNMLTLAIFVDLY